MPSVRTRPAATQPTNSSLSPVPSINSSSVVVGSVLSPAPSVEDAPQSQGQLATPISAAQPNTPSTSLIRETFGSTTITTRYHKNGTIFRVVRQQVHLTCSYPKTDHTVCGYTTFGGPAKMRNHVRTHALRSVNALFLCTTCGGRFSRRGALSTHHCGKRRGVHSIDAEFDDIVEGVREKLEAICTKQEEVEEAVQSVWLANDALLAKEGAANGAVRADRFPEWVAGQMAVLALRTQDELKQAVERCKGGSSGSIANRKRKRENQDPKEEGTLADEDAEHEREHAPLTPVSVTGKDSASILGSPESLQKSPHGVILPGAPYGLGCFNELGVPFGPHQPHDAYGLFPPMMNTEIQDLQPTVATEPLNKEAEHHHAAESNDFVHFGEAFGSAPTKRFKTEPENDHLSADQEFANWYKEFYENYETEGRGIPPVEAESTVIDESTVKAEPTEQSDRTDHPFHQLLEEALRCAIQEDRTTDAPTAPHEMETVQPKMEPLAPHEYDVGLWSVLGNNPDRRPAGDSPENPTEHNEGDDSATGTSSPCTSLRVEPYEVTETYLTNAHMGVFW